ncbi:N-acetylmuramoyl-L-alanine amidase family protein [Tenacibaculum sp.]|uniref:N-acetylmuramoyl-L-alanine amidase family protein n=1 Tax=Tenacibaculum sp. TaxID=1906242 RepID=UPI003D1344A6
MLITLNFWKCVKPTNVIFLLMLLKMCLVFGQQKAIVIDPGHGGNDSGTIRTNGIKEKSIVLDIALEI